MARLHGGLVDVGQEDIKRPEIHYRPSRVHFLIDVEVPKDKQADYLEALGCGVEQVKAMIIGRSIPLAGADMAIEEDVVEEVARLHGYEHIGETLVHMRFSPEMKDITHRSLRNLLVGMGLTEAMNYTFSNDSELAMAAAPAAKVRLQNPQSVERSILRTALYPGLLTTAHHNHSLDDLALFEIGHVFLEDEYEHLALLVKGDWLRANWLRGKVADFYLFKGLFEKLALTLGASFQLVAKAHPPFTQGSVPASVGMAKRALLGVYIQKLRPVMR
ncbi:MAG: hypothetical protein R2865_01455 [Deinococcales bacterium]